MDCKEFVWILTNASNTIIEKKLISVFFKKKKNWHIVISKFIFTEKNTVHV